MAKCVELLEISYETEKDSLHPMAKCVELHEISFNNATFSLCKPNLALGPQNARKRPC